MFGTLGKYQFHRYKNHIFSDKFNKKSFKLYMEMLDYMPKEWIWVTFIKNSMFLYQKCKLLPTTSQITMITLYIGLIDQ